MKVWNRSLGSSLGFKEGFHGGVACWAQGFPYLTQRKNWICDSFGPRVVWMLPWSMLKHGAAMPRSCWPGQRREPTMVRLASAQLLKASRTQTLAACRPLPLLPLELEFAKSIMKIAEAGKVAILQQVPALSRAQPPQILHPYPFSS